MTGNETVIGKFVNWIGLKVDQNSVKETQQAISSMKSYAQKAVGLIGIAFSLSGLRQITEEFNGINDLIRGTTREMGDQAEIQRKILDAANDAQDAYGSMAKDVTTIIQQNSELFPVDDAIKFVSLVEKLEKGAGRESNLGSTMSLLNQSLAQGGFNKEIYKQLETTAPEVVNAIAKSMGLSRDELRSFAETGKLTSKVFKGAIFSAEDDINKSFGELDYNFTALMTHMRNTWGYFIEDQLDTTYGLTNKLARKLRDVSDWVLDKAKKLADGIYKISEKLGGVDKLLKLIVMAAAAFFIAFKGDMLLRVLGGAVNLLTKANGQTALAAAKWLLLFLVLEDIWTFLQGGDSLIGRFLSDAGVDVDKLREKVLGFFDGAKTFGKGALDQLGAYWSEHGGSVGQVLSFLWTGATDLFSDIMTLGGHLFSLLAGLLTGFVTHDWTQFLEGASGLWSDFLDILNALGSLIFGDLWDPMKESAQEMWDFLKGFVDWFGEKFSAIRDFLGGISDKAANAGAALGRFFSGNTDEETNDGDTTSPENKGGTGGVSGRFNEGRSTGTQAIENRNAVSAFISGGSPVSTSTVSQRPISSTTNNRTITVRQENRQNYTFNVSDRDAASKLQSEVHSQSLQATDELARALTYGR